MLFFFLFWLSCCTHSLYLWHSGTWGTVRFFTASGCWSHVHRSAISLWPPTNIEQIPLLLPKQPWLVPGKMTLKQQPHECQGSWFHSRTLPKISHCLLRLACFHSAFWCHFFPLMHIHPTILMDLKENMIQQIRPPSSIVQWSSSDDHVPQANMSTLTILQLLGTIHNNW